MSRFTNDVDTISDALNNSFAMMVQSFIQIVGTLTLIFILNWQLSLIVLLCYILMFAVYPLQRAAQPPLLRAAAALPGPAQRLCRGDDPGAEGRQGVQP